MIGLGYNVQGAANETQKLVTAVNDSFIQKFNNIFDEIGCTWDAGHSIAMLEQGKAELKVSYNSAQNKYKEEKETARSLR